MADSDLRFTDHLRRQANVIWQAQHDHPFVRGIADGSLALERLEYWVRQDYLFLAEYCRVLAYGAARATDIETMRRFAHLLHSTVTTEMELHRAYAREFGISEEELETETMAPTSVAYTDFLVTTAATGDFAELAAALLPCMWAFSEIGQDLRRQPRPSDHRYAAWIDMYADPAFATLVEWCRSLLDRLADGADDDLRRRAESAFVESSKHELAFWEMSWQMERGSKS